MADLARLIPAEHVRAICKIGQGVECCRFLVAAELGFERAKHSDLHDAIQARVEFMTAKGDNCDGLFLLPDTVPYPVAH